MQKSMAVSLLLTACFALLLSAFPHFADMETHVAENSGLYLLEESGEWTPLDFRISEKQYSKFIYLPYPINYSVEVFGEVPGSMTGGAPIQMGIHNYYEVLRGRYLLQRVAWDIRDRSTQTLFDADQIYYGCSDLSVTQSGELSDDWLIETDFTHHALPGEDFLIGSTMYFTLHRPDGSERLLKLVNEL